MLFKKYINLKQRMNEETAIPDISLHEQLENYDDYYTLYETVEKIILSIPSKYLVNKTVFCPFDGVYSNFYIYLKLHFADLGLKKLLCASVLERNKLYTKVDEKTYSVITYDGKNEKFERFNVKGDYFDSTIFKEFYADCDIIITNPPFSIINKFFDCYLMPKGLKKGQLIEIENKEKKNFIMICNTTIFFNPRRMALINNFECYLCPLTDKFLFMGRLKGVDTSIVSNFDFNADYFKNEKKETAIFLKTEKGTFQYIKVMDILKTKKLPREFVTSLNVLQEKEIVKEYKVIDYFKSKNIVFVDKNGKILDRKPFKYFLMKKRILGC